jgi:hypothetical protein
MILSARAESIILSALPTESMILSTRAESIILSAPPPESMLLSVLPEKICPSGGSIGRIWSRFGVGVRLFLWNWSVRNGGVLGESSKYFRKASRRLSTGWKWDWHAPDAC